MGRALHGEPSRPGRVARLRYLCRTHQRDKGERNMAMSKEEFKQAVEDILRDEMEIEYGCCDYCGSYVEGHERAAHRIAELYEEQG